MKIIRKVELKPGSYEEELPGISAEFPYIASYVELDKYAGKQSPWHWHKEAELFYMEQGSLEYDTPQGRTVFTAGSGGFVNSNVLHMSRARDGAEVATLLHIFNPLLISGQSGSIIDRKYVSPLVTLSQIEIIGLYPDQPAHGPVLEALRRSFQISEDEYGYEIRLRAALSEIWCSLLSLAGTMEKSTRYSSRSSQKIKIMMAFIHKHCGDKLSVKEIAASAFISERECFRVFKDCLNMTPVEYVTSYRLQRACWMLAEGNEPITGICQACGLGSSSYFGKVFRSCMGCSPKEYRLKWRNSNIR